MWCKLKVSFHCTFPTSVIGVLLDSCWLLSKNVSQNILLGAKFSLSVLFFGISVLLIIGLWSDGLDKEDFFSCRSRLVVGESLAQCFCRFKLYSSNHTNYVPTDCERPLHFSRNNVNSFPCSSTLENLRTSRWHFWQTTVKPVYNGPVYSGHPVYNGYWTTSQKSSLIFTVKLTCI